MYFEFRSKPSLITVISIDPRPSNYSRQNIVFSYPEMIRVFFSLFLSFSAFLLFYVIINFYKNYFIIIIIFFMKIIFIFSCSGMFRNVQACFGMFRVPVFIDRPAFICCQLTVNEKVFFVAYCKCCQQRLRSR